MQSIKAIKGLFFSEQLVSEQSARWVIDCYRWALTHFDSQEFYTRTQLVQPTNQFFPGEVASIEEKADNIFQHSLKYAGLSHWPLRLMHPHHASDIEPPKLALNHIERNSAAPLAVITNDQTIVLSYNKQQTLKPEDLSSHFAHLFAQHMLLQSRQAPPGGMDYAVEASEVLAVFMGFGVMMANSAYTFRGGCGSCYNAAANRQAALTENEVLFALAVFCRIKQIDIKAASKGLKKHLKAPFNVAARQVNRLFKTDDNLLAIASA
ncbi:hypothetical protein WN093_12285 [Gammaproteobacteria bacterium AS21]